MRGSEKYWEAVVGRVVHSESGEPVKGVTVRAYDKDLVKDDFLGEMVTGADGTFRIEFPQSAYDTAVSVAEGRPDIYLRLSHPDLGSAKTPVRFEMTGELEKTDDPVKGGLDGELEVMDLGDVSFP